MTEKLKPCPFCGGAPVCNSTDSGAASVHRVTCSNCLAKTGNFTKREFATIAWDRRAPEKDSNV